MKIYLFLFLFVSNFCNAQSYCDYITKEVDKFNGEISFRSPLDEQIHFTKIISKKDTTYYMRLQTIGSTLNVGKKGVILLLSDSSRINKPEQKVDVEVASDGKWEYSAFIKLSKKEVKIFSKKTITDFRLYIYDEVCDWTVQEKYKRYFECLLSL